MFEQEEVFVEKVTNEEKDSFNTFIDNMGIELGEEMTEEEKEKQTPEDISWIYEHEIPVNPDYPFIRLSKLEPDVVYNGDAYLTETHKVVTNFDNQKEIKYRMYLVVIDDVDSKNYIIPITVNTKYCQKSGDFNHLCDVHRNSYIFKLVEGLYYAMTGEHKFEYTKTMGKVDLSRIRDFINNMEDDLYFKTIPDTMDNGNSFNRFKIVREEDI